MPTYIPKANSFERRWFVIDASGHVLGKVATTVASVLSGKRKPIYTPFLDTGDHVVVVNDCYSNHEGVSHEIILALLAADAGIQR